MKRIVSVILLTLVCFQGVAFATSSENEQWDKLVDYVNCRYVRAYIDGYVLSKPEGNDVKLYKENIKPLLDNIGEISFSDGAVIFSGGNPLKYEELSDLLRKNQWTGTDGKLASVINERKKNVGDVKELVSIDNFVLQMQNYLREDYGALCKLFSSNSDYSKEIAKLKAEIESLSEQLKSKGSEVNTYRSNADFWFLTAIVFMFLFLVVVALVVFFFFKYSKDMKQLRLDKEHYKSMCSELEADKVGKEKEIDQLTIQNSKLENKLVELQKTGSNPNEKVVEVKEQKQTVVLPENPKKEIRYFQYPNANLEVKQLFESESPNFYYKAIMEGSSRAKFEFCGKSEKAINNSDSYLANACEYKDIPANATKIYTDVLGVLVLQGNVWKVEKKALIHFS